MSLFICNLFVLFVLLDISKYMYMYFLIYSRYNIKYWFILQLTQQELSSFSFYMTEKSQRQNRALNTIKLYPDVIVIKKD